MIDMRLDGRPTLADRYRGRPDQQAEVQACWNAWQQLEAIAHDFSRYDTDEEPEL